MRSLACLLAVSALVLSLSACRLGETMEVAGVTREYRLETPPGLKAGAPLVVYLHGFDDPANPSPLERHNREVIEDETFRRGGAVLLPVGLKGTFAGSPEIVAWGPGREEENKQFLLRLVPAVVAEHDFDRQRVYIVGFASGGNLVANAVVTPFEGFFAGYALFGTGLATLDTAPTGATGDRRHVFIGVGRRDAKALDGANDAAVYLARRRPKAAVKLYVYDGGHEVTKQAANAAFEFLGFKAAGAEVPFKTPAEASSRDKAEPGGEQATPPAGWESSPSTPMPGGTAPQPAGPGTMPGPDTLPGGPDTMPGGQDTMPGS